jgi:1-acyl-sn-glycerol-3-phosphate acyltransferase
LRLEIIGTENLKEIKGPIIIAPNHTSELDPTVIPLIFPFLSLKLPIYSVIYPIEKYKTKDWKWKRFIYGKLFFNLLGGYSTYSGHKDYEISLENHIGLLKLGRTVCIFPEGKCTTDGNLGRARGGLGFLAARTNSVIIPLVINTFYGITIRDLLFRRRKVVLTVLPPIYPGSLNVNINSSPIEFKNIGQMVLDQIDKHL